MVHVNVLAEGGVCLVGDEWEGDEWKMNGFI